MKCPRNDCKNEASKHPIYGIMPCDECQKKDQVVTVTNRETVPTSLLHRRQELRDQHAKDLLQPWDGVKPNRDFALAYPEQIHNYYTQEQIKDMDI